MNELQLFAGGGGGILGGILLGHTCVCAVEINPHCRQSLLQRQRDKILPRFPIWDDVRTFDGKPWRGIIDAVCGGFPCQDISVANGKAEGITGARSGLWKEFARVVSEIRPRFILIENSPALLIRGIEVVFADLFQMGYDARWGVFSAADVGALHIRDRIFILAYPRCTGLPRQQQRTMADFRERPRQSIHAIHPSTFCRQDLPDDLSPPYIMRTAYEVANGLDRLKAIGNGQVPGVVEFAWKVLMPDHLKN